MEVDFLGDYYGLSDNPDCDNDNTDSRKKKRKKRMIVTYTKMKICNVEMLDNLLAVWFSQCPTC